MYTKALPLHLIKTRKRTSKEKKRVGEIGEHNLREMGALIMK